MSMNKRARRRANRNYSHSEPLITTERVDARPTRTLVVGFVDVRGNGQTIPNSERVVKRPFETHIPRRPAPSKTGRNDEGTED